MCCVGEIETFYCHGNSQNSTSDFDAHLTNVTSTKIYSSGACYINTDISLLLKNVYAAPKHCSDFSVQDFNFSGKIFKVSEM